jgi:hypothetical protein
MMGSGVMKELMEEVSWKLIVGVMYYGNGDKYTGEFKDNKREGTGKDKTKLNRSNGVH